MNTSVIQPKRSKWIYFLVWFLILAIFSTILFYAYINLQHSRLNDSFLSAQIKNNMVEIAQLQERANQLESSQAALQKAEKNSTIQYTKAGDMILRARNALLIDQDPEAARLWLIEAEKQIGSSEGPEFMALTMAINQDIAMLTNIPMINLASVAQQITIIDNQIDSLPAFMVGSNSATTPPSSTGWTGLVDKILYYIRQLFVVEKMDSGVNVSTMPVKDQLLLQTYLHTLMQQALLAAMEKNQMIYQSSLHQAVSVIQRTYIPRTPAIENLLMNVRALLLINIQPPLPNMLQSYAVYTSAQFNNNMPVNNAQGMST
jgi:uroporphyrin-3 C-methyltransferase